MRDQLNWWDIEEMLDEGFPWTEIARRYDGWSPRAIARAYRKR